MTSNTHLTLPPQADKTAHPLSSAEVDLVAAIWREHPGTVPPYDGLSEKDAILLHRYLTGYGPFDAQISVRRWRGIKDE